MNQQEREEQRKVIADFLEMGHVDNIIAMFKQDVENYALTGELIKDERFRVRIGVAVLFEELAASRPAEVGLAIPSLLPLLEDESPRHRGEAATLLGIIGTEQALEAVSRHRDDPDPQVSEIIADILADQAT